MKTKDRKELDRYKISLILASQLRCFPNGKIMSFYKSTACNQIGKCLELISYTLRKVIENKRPTKLLNIIRKCRIGLETEIQKIKPQSTPPNQG